MTVSKKPTRAEVDRVAKALYLAQCGGHVWNTPATQRWYRVLAKAAIKALAPGHGFNSERSQRAENGGRP